eukprot:TRINITY_DN18311_c0_g1_i1.p1 TRINITY_DN18311_c0_g1~~TRINITY_DN18311_c0_g1_i1.p1  ORF type:complete len:124 (+),score=2.91 TRINITY_DN18311_c0_g1_i1:150-521(+)
MFNTHLQIIFPTVITDRFPDRRTNCLWLVDIFNFKFHDRDEEHENMNAVDLTLVTTWFHFTGRISEFYRFTGNGFMIFPLSAVLRVIPDCEPEVKFTECLPASELIDDLQLQMLRRCCNCGEL